MKILLNLNLYPPKGMCGAEMMLHQLAKFLTSKGHEVKVIIPMFASYEYDGVQVYKEGPGNKDIWQWCDIVFTHLIQTGFTINAALHYRKKIVHFIHGSTEYAMVRARAVNNYIVYNSESIKRELNYPQPSFVLYPPCDYRHYDVGGYPFEREYITLINHCANKGGKEFIEIAKRMPDWKFLAVKGSYGEQVYDRTVKNITWWDRQEDIREVYKVTRLLLMPSAYESWGRTCTEAMCNGIPVIHAPTKGLLENTGDTQTALQRGRPEDWVEQIKEFDDESVYYLYSNSGRLRSRELDPVKNMIEFEKWLLEIHKQPYV